ncbi:MAG TPA: carbohydrate binding family 9 domain-containing protein, partial [Gemmatimonadaceae bacterium]
MLVFLTVLQLQLQSVDAAAGATANTQQPTTADSAGAALRVLGATKALTAPRIDGRLDDPVWATVPVATDFTQNYPHNGGPSARRTEARVVFVGDALYVGIRAFDSPDSIAAPLLRRDVQVINSDQVQILIDSFHDRRTAYEFGVTPSGVKFDVYHYDDIRGDPTWDAVWDVAVARDSLGWSAEFRIPLSQLSYSASPWKAETWGIQFYRNIGRLQEWSSWAPVPLSDGREVSHFGELTGIELTTSARRREIVPYLSSSLTRATGDRANPFFQRTALGSAAGLDAKIGVGKGLTLALTVHPDFGQVEADPS